jgi:hypothetical protein
MPDINEVRLPKAQSARDRWAKFHDPSSKGLVRNNNPAFQKHLFNFATTEVEMTMRPNAVIDKPGWLT